MMLEFEIFIELLLPVHWAAGIMPPPQPNMPIKGNALKTSFQHLELRIYIMPVTDQKRSHFKSPSRPLPLSMDFKMSRGVTARCYCLHRASKPPLALCLPWWKAPGNGEWRRRHASLWSDDFGQFFTRQKILRRAWEQVRDLTPP